MEPRKYFGHLDQENSYYAPIRHTFYQFSLVIQSTNAHKIRVNFLRTYLGWFSLILPQFLIYLPSYIHSAFKRNGMWREKWINVGTNKAQDNAVPQIFTAGCLPINGWGEKASTIEYIVYHIHKGSRLKLKFSIVDLKSDDLKML